MAPFAEILAAAEAREGGAEALAARLPLPKSAEELRALGDDRYLSLMSLRVFRAGLKHSLVDAKWPAFEAAFAGFEPRRVRAMNDEALEGLTLGNVRPGVLLNPSLDSFPPRNARYDLQAPMDLEDVDNPGPVLARIVSYTARINSE